MTINKINKHKNCDLFLIALSFLKLSIPNGGFKSEFI